MSTVIGAPEHEYLILCYPFIARLRSASVLLACVGMERLAMDDGFAKQRHQGYPQRGRARVVACDGRPVMSLEEYAPTFNLMHKHTHDALLALGNPQDAESRQVAMRRAQLAFNKEVEQERANHKLWLLPLGDLSADEQ
jgi:hypothetical protein